MKETRQLVEKITKGIQEKKGKDIVVADLTQIEGAIASYFVICQGGSPTQIEAITESVGDVVRIEAGEKPTSVVGLGTNQWVAMDYTDVIVHIFLPEMRQYYDLENLWQDAKLEKIANVE